ncbi:MAG: MFS transporter [Candidatus Omnitrophica bacterium]|nr:MFS transporter [Candidatus Omnitrophota bacterium]MDD5553055.1 MFS transporter [Candidatus Omnitrophota bacterium]
MKKATFIILCLEGAILSFNVAASAALIPSISKEFATPQFITARIVWLYMLPYGLAALFYGPMARAIDAKKLEFFCLALFSIANFLAGISRDITALFIARFLMGIFGASVIPLALILIANQVSQNKRGKSIGLFFSSTFVASLLGLFLSGLIPWRWLFLIPAAAGFICCPFLLFYLPSFKPEGGGFKMDYLSAFKDKRVATLFGYIFFISMFYHGVQQWLGVYFSVHRGFSQFLISMLITLTSLSGIFGEAAGGMLSDKFGRLKTVNSGLILMIVSVFALLLKSPVLVLTILMIAWGTGWTFNHAGISAMLTDLPKGFLNEAASLNSSVRFVSGGLGAALGGILMQNNFNLGFMFFGTCFLFLLFLTKAHPNLSDGLVRTFARRV